MTVYIKGKEVSPAARLLEVLTKSNLLSERITWEEVGDMIVLTVKDATPNDKLIFQGKKQYAVS